MVAGEDMAEDMVVGEEDTMAAGVVEDTAAGAEEATAATVVGGWVIGVNKSFSSKLHYRYSPLSKIEICAHILLLHLVIYYIIADMSDLTLIPVRFSDRF